MKISLRIATAAALLLGVIAPVAAFVRVPLANSPAASELNKRAPVAASTPTISFYANPDDCVAGKVGSDSLPLPTNQCVAFQAQNASAQISLTSSDASIYTMLMYNGTTCDPNQVVLNGPGWGSYCDLEDDADGGPYFTFGLVVDITSDYIVQLYQDTECKTHPTTIFGMNNGACSPYPISFSGSSGSGYESTQLNITSTISGDFTLSFNDNNLCTEDDFSDWVKGQLGECISPDVGNPFMLIKNPNAASMVAEKDSRATRAYKILKE